MKYTSEWSREAGHLLLELLFLIELPKVHLQYIHTNQCDLLLLQQFWLTSLKNYAYCMHAAISQSVNLHKVFIGCH